MEYCDSITFHTFPSYFFSFSKYNPCFMCSNSSSVFRTENLTDPMFLIRFQLSSPLLNFPYFTVYRKEMKDL